VGTGRVFTAFFMRKYINGIRMNASKFENKYENIRIIIIGIGITFDCDSDTDSDTDFDVMVIRKRENN